MKRIRPALLPTVLALCLTAACGSTVANQSQAPVAGLLDERLDAGLGTGGPGVQAPAVSGAPSVPSERVISDTSGGLSGSTGAGAGGTSTASSSGGVPVSDVAAATKLPIKVGFFSTDFAKAAAAISGGDSSSSTTVDGVWKQLVIELNKRGGLGGRRILPSSYVQDGTSNNYPQDYAAACQYFTRDAKVAVVLAGSIPDVPFAKCLLKAGIPTINVSHSGPDRASWSKVPGLLLPSGVSYDAAAVSLIDYAHTAGLLTKKDKLGIILSECRNTQQVFRDVVVPRLKRYGVGYESFTANECIQGFSGAASVGRGAASAVLRFKTSGVTQVMTLLASLENLMAGLFSQAAENQGYRPGYILSTGAHAEELYQGGTVPENQFKNMRGVGWVPTYDLYDTSVKLSPQGTRCLELSRAAGAYPTTPVARAFVVAACDGLLYLDAVLEQSRGSSDGKAFIAAARSLTRYVSAQTAGRTGDYRDIDGTEYGQPFAVSLSCTCVRYVGGYVKIAPPS